MINQAKILLQKSFSKTRNFFPNTHRPLVYVQSSNFGETKNIIHPHKAAPCLTSIKEQFHEAEKYLRKRTNLDEAIKKYQSILYSFNFTTALKPSYCLKALIGVGDALILQKEFSKGLDYYLLALAFYPEKFSEYQRAALSQKIGECYFELRDYTNSLEYFQKALELGKASGNSDNYVQGKIKMYIGRIYTMKNDMFQALEYFKEADEILPKEEENNYLLALTKANIATIQMSMNEQWSSWGTLFDAINLYEKSQNLNNAQKITILEEFVKSLDGLGFYTGLLERYEALAKLFKEEETEEADKKLVEVLMNIAETHCYRYRGYKEAAKTYKRVLEELDRMGYEKMKGDVYLEIGTCYWKRRESDEALDYLFKAVDSKKEHYGTSNVDIGRAYYYIGRVYYSEWEYEDSENYLAHSLRILRKYYDEDHEDILEVQKFLNKARQQLSDD